MWGRTLEELRELLSLMRLDGVWCGLKVKQWQKKGTDVKKIKGIDY